MPPKLPLTQRSHRYLLYGQRLPLPPPPLLQVPNLLVSLYGQPCLTYRTPNGSKNDPKAIKYYKIKRIPYRYNNYGLYIHRFQATAHIETITPKGQTLKCQRYTIHIQKLPASVKFHTVSLHGLPFSRYRPFSDNRIE